MFRITKQADYGIVLLTHLASSDQALYSAPDLAEVSQIPLPTVSKILKVLVRGGLLVSHRGVKGGYALSRGPESISVAEMISVLDGPIAFTECIDDGPGTCSQEDVCGVRENWNRINTAVRDALEAITLDDLTHPIPQPLVQLGHRRVGELRA